MRKFFALVTLAVSAQCPALNLVVDNLGDIADGNYTAGNLTLREAIFLANGSPEADSITFATAGTVSVGANDTTNPLVFGPTAFVTTGDLTITGNSGGTTIDGQNQRRLFGVTSGVSLTLDALTLAGGRAVGTAGAIGWAGGAGGGAAGLGGAIFNQGTLTLRNSTLTGNVAQGGDGGRFDAAAFFGGGGGGGLGSPAPSFSTSSTGAVGGGAAGGAGPSASFGNNGIPGGAGGIGGGGGGGSQGQTSSGSSTGGAGGLGGFGGGGGGGAEGFSFANPIGPGIGGAGGAGGFGGGGGAGASGFGTPSTGGIGGSSGFGAGSGGNGANSGNAGGGGGGGAGLGGAIFNHGGTVVLSNSTLAANSALGGSGGAGRFAVNNGLLGSGLGGAIFNLNGTVNVTHATLSGNTAAQGGQAIYSLAHETANGITPANAAANLANSILAETNAIAARKRGGDAGSSGISFTGPNVVTSAISITGGATSAGTAPINADPLLAALGNYGGPTQTRALLPGSPAINAGSNAGAPATDQRGIARPQQSTVDIGAFESRGFTLALTGGNNQSAGPGLVFASPLTATVTAIGAGEPVQGGVVIFTPPGAGASASLAPNPAPIAAGGVAGSTATANSTVGAYSVSAAANGATPTLSYALTNAGADLSIDNVTLSEGNTGFSNAVFTVTRTNSLTAFSVPYSITAGSAQAGSDYTTTSGTLNFAVGGAPTQTLTVPVVGDLIVEATETATLNLGAVSNTAGVTTITDGSGLLTINDNDSAVVTFNPVSVSQTEALSPMAFTVTLSNPVQSGVSLTLTSATGTATAPADFTAITAGTVSFPANSNTTQTVNVAIANDALDEDDESFTLTLSGLAATGSVTLDSATATGIVQDDDALPALSVANVSQPEGDAVNTLSFTVNLNPVSGRAVSFARATVDGTAISTGPNADFGAIAASVLTIPAGQTSVTIPVTINGNTTFEGDESFGLSLTAVSNATPASLSATATLTDDDQQPTTAAITSDAPDSSVVGQPYTVVVAVAAVSTSPLGAISISDGTDSCGPVTLTTGTAPSSAASCALTSTTAGAKTLTATYTPSTSAFAASSDTEAHQVNAATTSISVVGPPRSRINQPTSFTFALSVDAPGAGSPAGTVTLTSGAATCAVTVPTLTPSCALTFTTLGSRTVSAAFAPSDGNFVASSSSGAGNAQTLVFASSDIALTKTDVVGTYRPGDLLVYTVTLRNLGPDAAAVIRVRDPVPAGMVNVDWTCDASGGVACPAASGGGSGNLDLTVTAFPVGGLLNFTYFGNVAGSPAQIVNTVWVELPADTTIEDPNSGNNSASDTNLLAMLFKNGFEDAAVSSPAGFYRLPSLGLRGTLDEVARMVYVLDDANGEALRVYARLFGEEVQYALARRDAAGRLRLAAWRGYAGEPTLTWAAQENAAGWVLQTVELR